QFKNKGTLPEDIPANPNWIYKDKGWKGMGDWLGTGKTAPNLRQYLSFEKARKFVHLLKLKSETEWRLFCKGQLKEKGKYPGYIPSSPHCTYKEKGWKGMGDWLGTGTIAPRLRKYRPFGEARAFARSLGLKSQTEWKKFCSGQMPEKGKLPEDIPAKPDNTYKEKGWTGIRDWLGSQEKA
ncbi:MAG: integrase repeat-containing protein, partial [Syntrophales bacterium]